MELSYLNVLQGPRLFGAVIGVDLVRRNFAEIL